MYSEVSFDLSSPASVLERLKWWDIAFVAVFLSRGKNNILEGSLKIASLDRLFCVLKRIMKEIRFRFNASFNAAVFEW